jgi:hypothetical protein
LRSISATDRYVGSAVPTVDPGGAAELGPGCIPGSCLLWRRGGSVLASPVIRVTRCATTAGRRQGEAPPEASRHASFEPERERRPRFSPHPFRENSAKYPVSAPVSGSRRTRNVRTYLHLRATATPLLTDYGCTLLDESSGYAAGADLHPTRGYPPRRTVNGNLTRSALWPRRRDTSGPESAGNPEKNVTGRSVASVFLVYHQ